MGEKVISVSSVLFMEYFFVFEFFINWDELMCIECRVWLISKSLVVDFL